MSFWVYSVEPIPNTNLMSNIGRGFFTGYTPEYIQVGGITLPNIPGETWMELPESFTTLRHKDWTDKKGEEGEVYTSKIIAKVKDRENVKGRGIVFVDHEPTSEEKVRYEKDSREANHAFRKRVIDEYEQQVNDRQVTGIGRSKPTPYENECYEVLGLARPYSVEAFIAARQPGKEAAERIADAIVGAMNKPQTPVAPVKTSETS